MSLTTGARKEGLGLTFLLSFPIQRKRKRHTEKQREGQSMRLSERQKGC
jgi:hypothetical protein